MLYKTLHISIMQCLKVKKLFIAYILSLAMLKIQFWVVQEKKVINNSEKEY